MTNLGLNLLTDEQLLELLNEMLFEILRRDAYLRNLAQNAIYTKGKALKDMRTWYEALIKEHHDQQKAALKAETISYFNQWIQDKCLLTAQEERECIDEGFKTGRLQTATNALLDKSILISKRLTAAFAFGVPVHIHKEETPTLQTVEAYFLSGNAKLPHAECLLTLQKTLYGRFSQTTQGYFNRPPNPNTVFGGANSQWREVRANIKLLAHSAPIEVLKSLLIEYADNPAHPPRMRIDPVASAEPITEPESASETPKERIHITAPNECDVCRSTVQSCSRCGGRYCPGCNYCYHCGFTSISRRT